MTRLFTDGAESGDMLRWSTTPGGWVSSVKKRTGVYSYQIYSASGIAYAERTIVSTTEFYIRFAVAFDAAGVARFFEWLNDASEAGSLRTKTFGAGAATIEMYDGTTLRATSSVFSMSVTEWHIFEVHVKLAAAPNGVFQVKFDGALVLDWSGATNVQAAMNRFQLRSTQAAQATWYDDIAFNDTAGAVDNSWCGDGGVLAALVPITGAAEYADLIASTGNAWDCVNEIPANADYVYESTVNKKSTYLLSDLAGLPSGASIARVWVEVDALETAADGDKIATLLRSATTDAQGADQALTLAYARYLSAEYLVDPAGGEDPTWTEAKVNALQAGAVVR
jgi:hypothetical protein